MQRLFSSFPAGTAGAALLMLRCYLAASLVLAAMQGRAAEPVWMLIGAVAVAVLLCLGAMFPLCCALTVVLRLAMARVVGWEMLTHLAIETAQTLALALLGAGAYSIDARLYGRRMVILPNRRDR